MNYWNYLGVDQATLGVKYIDVVKRMEEGMEGSGRYFQFYCSNSDSYPFKPE